MSVHCTGYSKRYCLFWELVAKLVSGHQFLPSACTADLFCKGFAKVPRVGLYGICPKTVDGVLATVRVLCKAQLCVVVKQRLVMQVPSLVVAIVDRVPKSVVAQLPGFLSELESVRAWASTPAAKAAVARIRLKVVGAGPRVEQLAVTIEDVRLGGTGSGRAPVVPRKSEPSASATPGVGLSGFVLSAVAFENKDAVAVADDDDWEEA